MPKQTIINATTLYDGNTVLENKAVIVEGNEIVDITAKKKNADYEGIVTPGFIDGHSHIGMDREGEPYQRTSFLRRGAGRYLSPSSSWSPSITWSRVSSPTRSARARGPIG